MASMIPTAAGNSRLAALASRRRPNVDVNDMGIAVVGGDGTPLLTNRVDAISDRALGGVQQRGFSSPREAVATALDATGRTYRTGRIDQEFERLDEEASIARRMQEADELHKARVGNAVGALKARGQHDIYFSPEGEAMRAEDQGNKIALANAQQAGAIRKASADEYGADVDLEIAREQARADEVDARVTGASRSLAALSELRGSLRAPTPERKPGFLSLYGLLGGGTPASDPDAGLRQQYDQQTQRILRSLGLDVGQAPAAPVPEGQQQPAAPQRSQADAVRDLQIRTFAQRHEISPEAAEAILTRNGLLQ